MDKEQRSKLIDRLDRSFNVMPGWVKTACYHGSGIPKEHPETKEQLSFKQAIELGTDEFLETLKSDFEDNGDLLPE